MNYRREPVIVRLDVDEKMIADLHDAGLLNEGEFDRLQAVKEAIMGAILVVGRLGRQTYGDGHPK